LDVFFINDCKQRVTVVSTEV